MDEECGKIQAGEDKKAQDPFAARGEGLVHQVFGLSRLVGMTNESDMTDPRTS